MLTSPTLMSDGVEAPPLISIIWIGRHWTASAKSCVEALAERGLHCELVVHDLNNNASDLGAALLAALRACHGDYIAFWPMEGELDPGALETAVAEFSKRPHA